MFKPFDARFVPINAYANCKPFYQGVPQDNKGANKDYIELSIAQLHDVFKTENSTSIPNGLNTVTIVFAPLFYVSLLRSPQQAGDGRGRCKNFKRCIIWSTKSSTCKDKWAIPMLVVTKLDDIRICSEFNNYIKWNTPKIK